MSSSQKFNRNLLSEPRFNKKNLQMFLWEILRCISSSNSHIFYVAMVFPDKCSFILLHRKTNTLKKQTFCWVLRFFSKMLLHKFYARIAVKLNSLQQSVLNLLQVGFICHITQQLSRKVSVWIERACMNHKKKSSTNNFCKKFRGIKLSIPFKR